MEKMLEVIRGTDLCVMEEFNEYGFYYGYCPKCDEAYQLEIDAEDIIECDCGYKFNVTAVC